VRGERHNGLSPARKDIVAIRLGGDTLDLPAVQSRASGQMREQVVANIFFVVGGRLDVDERAR